MEVRTLNATEQLYREQAPKLWRSLVAFTGSREIASDAVAEAFALVIARGPAIRDPGRWIWRVSYRVAAGHLREQKEQVDLTATLDHSQDIERDADLMAAIAKLPERQRAAVVLHYLVDLPTAEVATTLGVTPTTVRVLLMQGRRHLRAQLGGPDG